MFVKCTASTFYKVSFLKIFPLKNNYPTLVLYFYPYFLNSLADIEEFEDTAETDFPDGYADTDGDGVGDNADVHPGFNDAELTTYLSNNNYAKTSEIIDARAGSILITVSNGVATVELEMEQSDDPQT